MPSGTGRGTERLPGCRCGGLTGTGGLGDTVVPGADILFDSATRAPNSGSSSSSSSSSSSGPPGTSGKEEQSLVIDHSLLILHRSVRDYHWNVGVLFRLPLPVSFPHLRPAAGASCLHLTTVRAAVAGGCHGYGARAGGEGPRRGRLRRGRLRPPQRRPWTPAPGPEIGSAGLKRGRG